MEEKCLELVSQINGLGGKFLVVLELPAGRVVFGVVTWGASLWVGALGCTGVELEAFPA